MTPGTRITVEKVYGAERGSFLVTAFRCTREIDSVVVQINAMPANMEPQAGDPLFALGSTGKYAGEDFVTISVQLWQWQDKATPPNEYLTEVNIIARDILSAQRMRDDEIERREMLKYYRKHFKEEHEGDA